MRGDNILASLSFNMWGTRGWWRRSCLSYEMTTEGHGSMAQLVIYACPALDTSL